jgi:hypothetical protein
LDGSAGAVVYFSFSFARRRSRSESLIARSATMQKCLELAPNDRSCPDTGSEADVAAAAALVLASYGLSANACDS